MLKICNKTLSESAIEKITHDTSTVLSRYEYNCHYKFWLSQNFENHKAKAMITNYELINLSH